MAIQNILYSLCLSLLLSGCVVWCHEPDQGGGGGGKEERVVLRFDWSGCRRASDVTGSMQLRFYGSEGYKDITSDTVLCEVQLPPGIYQVLARNSETPSIVYRAEQSYSTAEGYLPSLSRAAEVVGEACPLFVASLGTLRVGGGNVHDTLKLMPQACRVHLRVRIENSRDVVSVYGMLTHVATSVRLSTGRITPGFPGDMAVDFSREEDLAVTGEYFLCNVWLLGVAEEIDGTSGKTPNELHLTLVYTDGSRDEVTIDVTEEFTETNTDRDTSVDVGVVITGRGIHIKGTIIPWEGGGQGEGDIHK